MHAKEGGRLPILLGLGTYVKIAFSGPLVMGVDDWVLGVSVLLLVLSPVRDWLESAETFEVAHSKPLGFFFFPMPSLIFLWLEKIWIAF